MIDSSARLHDLDDSGLNHMLPVVLNLVLKVDCLSVLLSFGVHDWNFNFDQIVAVEEVYLELVAHFELFAQRILEQDLKLTQWNQV